MSEFSDLMEEGMREMEEMIPDSITINGISYSGCFTELDLSITPELGGIMNEYSASFVVRKSALATPPKVGAKVMRQGKTYKVASVVTDTASHTLNLENLNHG